MTPTKACELKEGDVVDLVDDEFVDVYDRLEYEFEFAEVLEIAHELNHVIVTYTNGDEYEYPIDHLLMVDHNASEA